MNNAINGDCLIELKKIQDNSIDLIYLDPPFYTQKKQKLTKKTDSSIECFEFEDSWKSINEYLRYLRVRLKECKRVLKLTGSIFLHCDRNACHYLKTMMDEIFGENNFRSEIIWSYKRWSNSKKGLLNSHQNIYFYSKTDKYKFNTFYTSYSCTTNLDQILQNRIKDKDGITTYQKNANGQIVSNFNKKGVPLSDVWEIPYLNPKAKERNGYPTQKPILLLERIIKIATDEGDIVLDPFCGSGTTLAAAKLLKRNYLGFDLSTKAIELCNKRLNGKIIKTNSQLLEKGIQKYNTKSESESEFIRFVGALPVQRNKGIDAIIPEQKNNKAIAIKFQRETESLTESVELLNKACKIKGIDNKILLALESPKTQNLFDDYVNLNTDVKIYTSIKDILFNLFNR